MFGRIIRLLRESKGWTQSELSDESKVPTSTISRIEKGKMDPSENVVKGFANAFGVNPKMLKIDFSTESQEKIRIGFGHCIWAAPIIKLIMEEGGIKNTLITSYGISETEDEKPSPNTFEPRWHDLEEYQKTGKIRFPSSIFRRGEVEELPTYEKEDSQTKIKIYTADTLLSLMNAGVLDCILVPGGIYYSRYLSLDRAAHIVYTDQEGCLMCVVGDNEGIEQFDIKAFIPQMNKYFDSNLIIFYPRRTIADTFIPYFENKEIKIPIKFKHIDLEKIDDIKLIIKKRYESKQPFIILGWEPQTSWINAIVKEISEDSWGLKHFEITNIFDFQESKTKTPFLSFDVLFNKSRLQELIQNDKWKAINHFFKILHASVERLSDKGNVRTNAELMASYLDMEQERAEEALKLLNFRFMHYPEWLNMIESNKNN